MSPPTALGTAPSPRSPLSFGRSASGRKKLMFRSLTAIGLRTRKNVRSHSTHGRDLYGCLFGHGLPVHGEADLTEVT
jgi:hypothetical protein